jgi:hypothetical protein
MDASGAFRLKMLESENATIERVVAGEMPVIEGNDGAIDELTSQGLSKRRQLSGKSTRRALRAEPTTGVTSAC